MKRINYDNHVNLERRIFFSCETCGEFRIKKQSVVIGKKNYCSPKCQAIGNMDNKHSNKTKLKISINNASRRPEVKQKMRLAKLGKKQNLSPEQKAKISKARKKLWKDPNYRKLLSKSIFQKGHSVSASTREKIAESRRGSKHWTNYLPYTDEHKAKLREARLHQAFPVKDSKPERIMQLALALRKIQFTKHVQLIGQPDIFIEPNICVFIDGDYWHANPDKYDADDIIIKGKKASDIWKKDIKVNHELNKLGYAVFRIWEHDILTNADNCAKNILSAIQDLYCIGDSL